MQKPRRKEPLCSVSAEMVIKLPLPVMQVVGDKMHKAIIKLCVQCRGRRSFCLMPSSNRRLVPVSFSENIASNVDGVPSGRPRTSVEHEHPLQRSFPSLRSRRHLLVDGLVSLGRKAFSFSL